MGSEMVGWKYEIFLSLKNSATPKFMGAVVPTKLIADEIITTSEPNSAARGELELRQQLWYFPLELCSYVLSELSLMDFESLGSLWIRGGNHWCAASAATAMAQSLAPKLIWNFYLPTVSINGIYSYATISKLFAQLQTDRCTTHPSLVGTC